MNKSDSRLRLPLKRFLGKLKLDFHESTEKFSSTYNGSMFFRSIEREIAEHRILIGALVVTTC